MSLTFREIFVTGLKVEAAIGIYDHEHGRTQPLLIDAFLTIGTHPIAHLKDTLNYELVGRMARELIARGHIKLVETLAEELGAALLELGYVKAAEVRITKPEALSDAEAAGVRVRFEKTTGA
jgi:7,8-dihydroneopterin aldolase/epimerase/oxygenase